MYWGEGVIYAATSDDLIRWTPLEIDAAPDRYLTWRPRSRSGRRGWRVDRVPGRWACSRSPGRAGGRFDSLLTEPGPPAMLTEAGVVLIYNGANHPEAGEPATPALRLPARPDAAGRRRPDAR